MFTVGDRKWGVLKYLGYEIKCVCEKAESNQHNTQSCEFRKGGLSSASWRSYKSRKKKRKEQKRNEKTKLEESEN